MITAMILAGGSGTRVGADRPKQFVEISGRPVLSYTIEKYQANPQVDSIEIVCHKDWMDYVRNLAAREAFYKVRWIVQGGNTFLESVICGMKELEKQISPEDMVMVQYAASPLTSQKILDDSIRVCREHGMSASCTPCYQLLGDNGDNATSRKWIDRDKIVQICCPQSFRLSYLMDLISRGEKEGLLHEVEPHITSLMYALGETIYQSYGNQANIKITTKEDIEFLQELIAEHKRDNDYEG